ncbi:MAG TPA: hypothetical protein VF045_10565 [Acidimicrobiales bacterium]
MTVVVLIETVVIGVLGLLVLGLLRSHAEILRTLRQLEAGTARPGGSEASAPVTAHAAKTSTAADVMGTTLDDEVVKIGVAGARHNTLLAFLSSGCLTCQEFWDTFSRRTRLKVPGDARLVIVTKDAAEESPSRLRELAPRSHPTVMSTGAWEAYGVPVAPYFVYVDGPSGQLLGQGAASDWDQVVDLWDKALAGGSVAGGASPGRRRHRHARADSELLSAGIQPGDDRLYGKETQ